MLGRLGSRQCCGGFHPAAFVSLSPHIEGIVPARADPAPDLQRGVLRQPRRAQQPAQRRLRPADPVHRPVQVILVPGQLIVGARADQRGDVKGSEDGPVVGSIGPASKRHGRASVTIHGTHQE